MAFRDKVREILRVKDTPHRIAISFALGVFMGISPLFGIHTISAFFLAWLFRLNRFVAVVGVYVTNPWTVVPIYSFSLWVGAKIIGMKQILPDVEWASVTFKNFMVKLANLVLPFVIGAFVVGFFTSIVSYFIIYGVVIRYRKIKDGA